MEIVGTCRAGPPRPPSPPVGSVGSVGSVEAEDACAELAEAKNALAGAEAACAGATGPAQEFAGPYDVVGEFLRTYGFTTYFNPYGSMVPVINAMVPTENFDPQRGGAAPQWEKPPSAVLPDTAVWVYENAWHLLCEHCREGKNIELDPSSGEVRSVFCGSCRSSLSGRCETLWCGCGRPRYVDQLGAVVGKLCIACHQSRSRRRAPRRARK